MTRNTQLILAAGVIAAGLTTTVLADTKAKAKAKARPAAEKSAAVTITTAEVNGAQQAWCDALVAIGKVHAEGGDAKALATRVLSEAYAYDTGRVFFKPTLTHGEQTFRPTKQGALAYFVGGDPAFPDDKGFALKPWVKARYDNLGDGDEGIQIHGDIAITMGNVWVTDKDGNEVKVDKTFVFQKGADGKLRIILHKSALPYTPPGGAPKDK